MTDKTAPITKVNIAANVQQIRKQDNNNSSGDNVEYYLANEKRFKDLDEQRAQIRVNEVGYEEKGLVGDKKGVLKPYKKTNDLVEKANRLKEETEKEKNLIASMQSIIVSKPIQSGDLAESSKGALNKAEGFAAQIPQLLIGGKIPEAVIQAVKNIEQKAKDAVSKADGMTKDILQRIIRDPKAVFMSNMKTDINVNPGRDRY